MAPLELGNQGERSLVLGPRSGSFRAEEGALMSSVWVSMGVATVVFACGILGLNLQQLLPEPHTSDRSRDMIGAMVGLVSLLLALVLGTIIGSAYGFYANQKAELESLTARTLQLDLALSEYGPETKIARDRMKAAITHVHDMFWGGEKTAQELTVASAMGVLRGMDEFLVSLNPQTPAQKQLLANAGVHWGSIEQIRLLMSLQLATPVSWPLLIIVVSRSLLLFAGFGLLSRINGTTVAALAFGAFAVASAVFLILELSRPFTGLFRIPPAALEQTISALDG
jgi:hypothetical protein